MLRLHPRQAQIREDFETGRVSRILLWWTTGSGKTLAALACAQAMMAKDLSLRLVISCTLSVVSMWKEATKRLGETAGLPLDLSRVQVMSHGVFASLRLATENTFLIYDEVHTFRTIITHTKGALAKAHVNAAQNSSFFIGLSGTLIVNNAHDLVNPLKMVTRTPWSVPPIHYKPYVNVYMPSRDEIKLPELAHHSVKIVAKPGDGFSEIYDEIEQGIWFKNSMTFLTIVRQISHNLEDAIDAEIEPTPEGIRVAGKLYKMPPSSIAAFVKSGRVISPKIKAMVRIARWAVNQLHKKVLIRTEYVRGGVQQLKRLCEEAGLRVARITGDMAPAQRDAEIIRYNNPFMDERGAQVLIVSAAGEAGVNCNQSATGVVVLDTAWNTARKEQATARVCRFGSHEHLNPEDRVVQVIEVSYVRENPELRPTADTLLERACLRKDEYIARVLTYLKSS
jgi:hypothetical protein